MIARLIHPTRKPLTPIDVIANRGLIIPHLEILLDRNAPYDLREDAAKSVMGLGGEFPKEWLFSLDGYLSRGRAFLWGRDDSYGFRSANVSVTDRGLEGDTILFGSIDARVMRSVIEGRAPLAHAVKPTLIDSFLIGEHTLGGKSGEYSYDEKFEKVRTDISKWTPQQYRLFMEMQETIMTKDPAKILQGLSAFGRTLTNAQYRHELRFLNDRNRQVLDFVVEGLVVESLNGDYPNDVKRRLKDLQRDGRVLAAAQILYKEMSNMAQYRDTYHVSVNNSVVVGERPVTNVKGGTIDSSIIAGEDALQGSNLNVRNTYVVTPKGVRFIEDGVIGKPSLYETLPLSLTDSRGLFRAMNYYRDPAIRRHFKVRGY